MRVTRLTWKVSADQQTEQWLLSLLTQTVYCWPARWVPVPPLLKDRTVPVIPSNHWRQPSGGPEPQTVWLAFTEKVRTLVAPLM